MIWVSVFIFVLIGFVIPLLFEKLHPIGAYVVSIILWLVGVVASVSFLGFTLHFEPFWLTGIIELILLPLATAVPMVFGFLIYSEFTKQP